MADTLGANFAIDITQLKAGLTQANRLIRESESEFRAAAAGMDDWSASQEGLEARTKTLNDQIGIQEQKVSALVAEKKRIVDQMTAEGKTAEQVARAVDGVNKQITAESKTLDRLKSDLDKNNKALDSFTDETDDAADSAEDASEGTEDFGDSLGKLSGVAGVAVKAVAAVGAAAVAAVGSFFALAESTRESRSEMAKLETAYTQAGLSAEDATSTFNELYGVLGDEGRASESAAFLAQYADDEKELAEQTRILTGVFATYGDSIPTEGLAEGIAASISMSETQGVLADALEWQGVNLEEFNEKLATLTTEQEREALITNTLNGLYGEAADSYKEINADVIAAQEAQAGMNQAMADLGAKAEPIMTKLKEGFTRVLEAALELVNDVDFAALGATIDKAFTKVIDEVIPKIEEAVTWIIDNKDALIAAIVGVGAAFAAWNVVTMIQRVVKAVKAFGSAQAVLNAVMAANPIGLIVAAIAALVAAFIYLWKNCEGFRKFWLDLWKQIKKAVSGIDKFFKKLFTDAAKNIEKAFSGTKKFFSGIWDGIKKIFSGVGDFFKKSFELAWDAIVLIFKAYKTFFSGVWDGIKNIFSSTASWFGSTFSSAWNGIKNAFSSVGSFFSGIWTSIKNAFSSVSSWFSSTFTSAWNGIKNAFSAVGSFFSGIWNDTKNAFASTVSWFDSTFSSAWNGIKNAFSSVGSFFSGIWSSIKNAFSSTASWFGSTFSAAWTAIKNVFSSVGSFFGGIWDTIKSKFTSIGTKVGDAIGGAFKSAANAAIATVERALNAIPNAVNKMLGKINELPGVNIGQIPTVTLPRLAKGGIVDRSTIAQIGEDGREAVIPLERNTGWIKTLAKEIAAEKKDAVVVNQVNNYSQTHSRFELYKSRQQTAAAVKLALGGAN